MLRNHTTAYVHKGTQFEFLPSPALCASCNDCCIVQSNSACADPELVDGGGGWSCMLLLHHTLTCADACLDLCTLCWLWLSLAATCGGVLPSAVGTNTPLTHVVTSSIANCTNVFFLPPTDAVAVHALKQLALCGSGFWWW